MKINFHFLEKTTLLNRKRLKAYLGLLASEEKKKIGQLDIIFCSDAYLLAINKSYLNHNYYTDIITFDLTPNQNEPITGEIYISIETIKSNALLYKATIENELHRVIFHGVLHLCGFKDKKPEEKKTMTRKENQHLEQYFKF
jgi:rRNA maturation RNase YbeY